MKPDFIAEPTLAALHKIGMRQQKSRKIVHCTISEMEQIDGAPA